MADGNYQQVTSDDARSGLVPERELGGDRRLRVDAALDLGWSKYEQVLWILVDQQVPVVRLIASGREPANHVLPVAGNERHHEQELGVRLPWQPHDDVIGIY